jgi:hypothetical protein
MNTRLGWPVFFALECFRFLAFYHAEHFGSDSWILLVNLRAYLHQQIYHNWPMQDWYFTLWCWFVYSFIPQVWIYGILWVFMIHYDDVCISTNMMCIYIYTHVYMLFNKYRDILDDFLHGYGSNSLNIALNWVLTTGCWVVFLLSDRSKQLNTGPRTFKSHPTPNIDIKNHS